MYTDEALNEDSGILRELFAVLMRIFLTAHLEKYSSTIVADHIFALPRFPPGPGVAAIGGEKRAAGRVLWFQVGCNCRFRR